MNRDPAAALPGGCESPTAAGSVGMTENHYHDSGYKELFSYPEFVQ